MHSEQSDSAGTPALSVVIPNHNGALTIGRALEALEAATPPPGGFEVIVVDDASDDSSLKEIKKHRPSRLLELPERAGASGARNRGAREARGKAIFFIDSDCLVLEESLLLAWQAYESDPGAATGGTYTPRPPDRDFFSGFQSIFVHYFETKGALASPPEPPDYLATHAMVIDRELFMKSGGFREDFLPIIEDVEFSHRLRREGIRLKISPGLEVRHVFGFSFLKSLKNAFRKARYWTAYSAANRDLGADSGTASIELKANAALSAVAWPMLLAAALLKAPSPLIAGLLLICLNVFINRKFLGVILKNRGAIFTAAAFLYYSTLYALMAAVGGLMGLLATSRPRIEKTA